MDLKYSIIDQIKNGVMIKLLSIGGENMKVDAYDGDTSSYDGEILKKQSIVPDDKIIAPIVTGIKQNDILENICLKFVFPPNFLPI